MASISIPDDERSSKFAVKWVPSFRIARVHCSQWNDELGWMSISLGKLDGESAVSGSESGECTVFISGFYHQFGQ